MYKQTITSAHFPAYLHNRTNRRTDLSLLQVSRLLVDNADSQTHGIRPLRENVTLGSNGSLVHLVGSLLLGRHDGHYSGLLECVSGRGGDGVCRRVCGGEYGVSRQENKTHRG